ncbi:SpoIIE family protein phosphatase [Streptomyces sp. TG1A-8]|uniref:SpoIIE family protein phosphatase n=1 Tax=Streptomyces sp. TG1A-8 TaxID=3051385 RepID=UPI00265B91E6|nr:SpoIIE family protein phosphatase [Streptomyces sp. TG1A-8]MDO0929125.1 SpoIIE family protein phosphatase [Streptomyces sp. TG1A-8]
MPSPVSADRPAAQPPGRGPVEALISQTRRLKGDVDAVRRDAKGGGSDPEERWQRALYDLALHQLDDLDAHLAQLRDGPACTSRGALLSRVGSAEWNLLTDEANWSAELYRILGLDPGSPALTLDELPSLVLPEDRSALTAMVTGCLVDGKPIDGEFRIVRPDATVRTVHMMGEPVLGADGGTSSMWAVLRDVSELRRHRRTVRETRASVRPGQGPAAGPWEAAPPPRYGSTWLPHPGPRNLDLAAHRLPATTGTPAGGDWYDALDLPDGTTLLCAGELTGHGAAVASGTAMLLGAVRGMAMSGTRPGRLLDLLDRLLDATAQPALVGAVICHYRPATRTLVWARAGHPAPLLYRGGTGRLLSAPDRLPPGAAPGTAHGQAEAVLEAGDVLLLHTDGLLPGHGGTAAVDHLLGLAPRLGAARTAQDCLMTVVEACDGAPRGNDACVLVARVG